MTACYPNRADDFKITGLIASARCVRSPPVMEVKKLSVAFDQSKIEEEKQREGQQPERWGQIDNDTACQNPDGVESAERKDINNGLPFERQRIEQGGKKIDREDPFEIGRESTGQRGCARKQENDADHSHGWGELAAGKGASAFGRVFAIRGNIF